jgi:hypothetical protein
MTEGVKRAPTVLLGFRTNNGDTGSFNPWNSDVLETMGVTEGALDPKTWSYHVRGDLYEIPELARKNHECGGSVNVQGRDVTSGYSIEISHVFYIDLTGHSGQPYHWNHEIYTKKNDGEWILFDKRKTKFHKIPISDNMDIWVKDSEGNWQTKTVSRK